MSQKLAGKFALVTGGNRGIDRNNWAILNFAALDEDNGVRNHFAARGGDLVHLRSSVCPLCLVRRMRETRQPRALDRLFLDRLPPHNDGPVQQWKRRLSTLS